MPSKFDALKALENKKSKLADALVADFGADLRRALKQLNSRVSLLIGRLKVDDNDRLVSDQINLTRAINARQEIINVFERAGYSDSVKNLIGGYDDLSVLVKQGLALGGAAVSFTQVDISAIQALKQLDFQRWSRFGDEIIGIGHEQLVGSVIGTANVGTLSDAIAGLLTGEGTADSLIDSRADTIANTLTQAFDRTLTMRKSEEAGIDTFIYLGPDDQVTRPFCKAVLDGKGSSDFNIPKSDGGLYTRDQIDDMDNGVAGLPVMEFGGGYNCRHKFAPLSKRVAKEVGI